jgi:amino acid adenylation domain-containing protein
MPGRKKPKSQAKFVAPRTPVEEELAKLWGEVLGIERLGVNDNFFQLAGDSISAIRLLSCVNEVMGVEFPLLDFVQKPTVAGMALAIIQHQKEKLESPEALPKVVPDEKSRHLPFPLTDIQQAYWVGRNESLELGNVACHLYTELQFADLDIKKLELAWQRLISRHEMLRAVVLNDGQQQILAKVPPYHIEVWEQQGQSPEEAASHLESVRQRMSHQVLKPDQWPLFEIRASRLSDEATRLHISFDLLFADFWSLRVISRELSQLYLKPDTRINPPRLSFRDCVLAEANLENSEAHQHSLDYWQNRLATLPPAPGLPLKKSPGSVAQPNFVRLKAKLGPATWLRLKNRGSRRGLTPTGVLLAAFAEVLKVWSSSPRFSLNLTLFNRLPWHPQVDDIVGNFTSSLLLEVSDLAEDIFEARAQQIQQQLWQDLDHRRVSGVRVLRELGRSRGGTAQAVMPVVFTSLLTQDAPEHDIFTLDGLGEVLYSITQTPQVWLDHQVYEQAGALFFNWDAVEEIFPEGLLEDMFQAYCRLLQRLADEEASWQEDWWQTALSLVPPAQLEQRAVINDTGSPVSAEMLHTLFVEQVSQRANQPAVVSGSGKLTYQELYRRSNQVGYQLRQMGAGPNSLVAVVMEKSAEQVLAVLGVLQSGAAYLPVAPALPRERFQYLLRHGEVRLALTQSWLDEKLEWPEGVQRLCLDGEALAGLPDQALKPAQRPDDLAYVIYTSGSTGLPKGVMISHRSAVNTITDVNQRFGVGTDDRVLALSSLSFDLAVYDIFGTLAAGGTIVMPEAAAALDPAHWAELITREKVTIWNSVPALMEMFLEYMSSRPKAQPRSLRLVLLSGDWIPVKLSEQIRRLSKGARVISLGGATEASIWSVLYPIGKVDPGWNSIPYGRPMVNQRLHVLNEALEPCPVWVPGQLYIAGLGLAEGYRRDEGKTRSSFFEHPRTGERLYRTGDIGRYLPDGNIEFLGREDFQVKIQGFRIELGEIEAALVQHPGVRAAVVTAVGRPQENRRLVAYVVPEPGQKAALNLLSDPLERLEFKRKQPGLRQDSDSSYIQLGKPRLDKRLAKRYIERRSYRRFQHQPVSLENLSKFLSCLLQFEFEGLLLPKYQYASAGSLYPVQVYLYIKQDRVEGVPAGTYYYHPKEHRLVSLSADANVDRSVHEPTNQPIFDESAFSLFLVGQLGAMVPIYGEASLHYATLEAGLMCQLLEMSAPDCHLGLCQIGSLDFEPIRHLFALEESYVLLHCLLGGPIAESESKLPALVRDADEYHSLLKLLRQEETSGLTVDELRGFLREKLPEYMLPSEFVMLDALPLTPSGKIDRQALPDPQAVRRKSLERADLPALLSGRGQQSTYAPPRDEVEQILLEIWQQLLGIEQIGVQDNFFELGGYSLLAVRLLRQIEERLNRELPLATIFRAPTIEQLASVIRQREPLAPEAPLVAIQPQGSKQPFFCVHPLFGEVVAFADLAQHLGPEQPFYGLQAQGLDGKQPPLNRIEDMTVLYIKEMRSIQPEGPYLLGGKCFGGMVAFEMAQQLQAQGQKVALLALLDSPCPPFKSAYYLRYRLIHRGYLYPFLRNLFKLRPADRPAYAMGRAKTAFRLLLAAAHLKSFPSEEFYRLRVGEANDQAVKSYLPQAYRGRIVHFLASTPLIRSSHDPRLDWAKLAADGVEVYVIPGDHDGILQEPRVRLLAEKLKTCLESAQRKLQF